MARDPQDVNPNRFLDTCNERGRFKVVKIIGKGSYGIVAAAIDHLTGEKVAIKRMKNVFDNVADAQRILREIKLLRMLQHPGIVKIKHIVLPPTFSTFNELYVVTELMEADLHTVIGANDHLTAEHHRVFLYQLLRGLKFMHDMGVLHRDLKPQNILANADCKLRICDLGLARPVFHDASERVFVAWTDYIATRWYRAPELCGSFYGCYSQAVDIWSIGCVFAELLLGRPLFPGRDVKEQLVLITDLLGKPADEDIELISNRAARAFVHAMPPKPRQPLQHKFPNAHPLAVDLLQHLLAFSCVERYTAAQALDHPYFEGLPKAGPAECQPITPEEFEFEQRKLSEADVRNLIYLEALSYQPAVLARYAESTGCLQRVTCQLGVNISDSIRRQFCHMEQDARGAGGTGAATAPWTHHQAASLHQQQGHQDLVAQAEHKCEERGHLAQHVGVNAAQADVCQRRGFDQRQTTSQSCSSYSSAP